MRPPPGRRLRASRRVRAAAPVARSLGVGPGQQPPEIGLQRGRLEHVLVEPAVHAQRGQVARKRHGRRAEGDPRRHARRDFTQRPADRERAVAHDRHPVRERLRLLEVVRRQQDRRPRRHQLADHLPRAPARLRVQAGRRLVEQQQLGRAVDRERDLQTPLLAAGELLDAHVATMGEVQPLEVCVDVPAAAGEPRPQRSGLAHRQLTGEAALLEHDPGPRPHGPALAQRVVPEHAHGAGGGRAVALERLERRRLARAVGAEQGEDLSALHAEVDPVDGDVLAVDAPQSRYFDHGPQPAAARGVAVVADCHRIVCSCHDLARDRHARR